VIGPNGERTPVVVSNVTVTPAAADRTATPLLDEAAKKALARDRAKVQRNQQLMHSITPRTNNDRTDQAPDDPPSPALSLSPIAPR
jgi:hypothetical protein